MREIRVALRRMLEDPEDLRRFAMHVARAEGWSCFLEPEKAAKRVLRVFNASGPGHAPRNLDADWITIAIDCAPVDLVTPILVRRAALAELRREQAAERRPVPVLKVVPARKRGAA